MRCRKHVELQKWMRPPQSGILLNVIRCCGFVLGFVVLEKVETRTII